MFPWKNHTLSSPNESLETWQIFRFYIPSSWQYNESLLYTVSIFSLPLQKGALELDKFSAPTTPLRGNITKVYRTGLPRILLKIFTTFYRDRKIHSEMLLGVVNLKNPAWIVLLKIFTVLYRKKLYKMYFTWNRQFWSNAKKYCINHFIENLGDFRINHCSDRKIHSAIFPCVVTLGDSTRIILLKIFTIKDREKLCIPQQRREDPLSKFLLGIWNFRNTVPPKIDTSFYWIVSNRNKVFSENRWRWWKQGKPSVDRMIGGNWNDQYRNGNANVASVGTRRKIKQPFDPRIQPQRIGTTQLDLLFARSAARTSQLPFWRFWVDRPRHLTRLFIWEELNRSSVLRVTPLKTVVEFDRLACDG